MSKKIKGVIFSIRDVLTPKDDINDQGFNEVIKLLKFLINRNIQPVVLANRSVFYKGQHVKKLITKQAGDFPWFITNENREIPKKPTKAAIPHVLSKMNWSATEIAYVGAKDDDMRTAVNAESGSALFLNACWFNSETEYGIKFQNPKELARFVDIFCVTGAAWGFLINDEELEFYALGTFSTYYPEFADYSTDARAAAKNGTGHLDFWTKYLWSNIYFSGLHQEIDIITSYPGHRADRESQASSAVKEPLEAFGKCFRIEYLSDLIVRHTTSIKSQTARNKNIEIGHANQLNTIHINHCPIKNLGRGKGQPYKNFSLEGKTILVVDDITTRGFSLEAARVYLKKAGAKRVILLSWLKTINTDYSRIRSLTNNNFDPLSPCRFPHNAVDRVREYPFREHRNEQYQLINDKFNRYRDWNWG